MPNLISQSLQPQIIINKTVYNIEQAALLGLTLSQTIETFENHRCLTLHLQNNSDQSIRLDKFNWHRDGIHPDMLSCPNILIYLEGWQMSTPCGVRKYGDNDFIFDPWYMQYAITEPEDYETLPNHFRAEHMMMFHNPSDNRTLLAGFITGADQFGHFKVILSPNGVASLDIRSSCDGTLIDPGEQLHSETLVLMEGTDGYSLQCSYASLLGSSMHARIKKTPPTGWCSWSYYFDKVTQEDIINNVTFLAANREKYPLNYIQLDDGYQKALGDWLLCNEKFPDGLCHIANFIRSHGFIPALWIAPFLAEETSLLIQEHPDWMIHDSMGNIIYHYPWRGNRAAVLDGTHPEVQMHLKHLFSELRKMGFEYVKLDFLMTACTVREGILYDSKATRAQALRRGLTAIRSGFGEDGFLLGCTVPFLSTIGIVDGARISGDIAPYWVPEHPWYDEAPTMPNSCRNVIRHMYMNKRLWNNDPDNLLVRDDNTKLTENEVKVWFELIRHAGGMLLLGDNLVTLSSSRSLLAEKLLSENNQYHLIPLDFWNSGIPSVLEASHIITGKKTLIRINFTDEPAEIAEQIVPPHNCMIL